MSYQRKKRQWKYIFSVEALPAWGLIALGFCVMMTPRYVEQNGYKGHVLIASEVLKPPLDKSLILIEDHTVDRSFGLVLNKPLPQEVYARLPAAIRDAGIPVGYGGPVDFPDRIVVLEEKEAPVPGQKTDFDIRWWHIAVRETPDLPGKIRRSIEKGEHRYRLFAGYAAWRPFQLDAEIVLHDMWDAVPMSHDLVFQQGETAQWEFWKRQKQEQIQSFYSKQT